MVRWIAIASIACAVHGCDKQRADGPARAQADLYARFLLEHHARYPDAEVADYYKLIHQSVFGVGHLIRDEAAARAYLDREIAGLAPLRPDEPLFTPLDPSSTLVRVNLRPYVSRRLDRETLIDAMIETARLVRGDPAVFAERWNVLRALVAERHIALPLAEFTQLERVTSEAGYPARHHSPRYRDAYAPAYRVVLRRELERRQSDATDQRLVPGAF